MASVHGLDRRVGPRRHELLRVGRDHVVLGPDQRPGRNRLPSWRARRLRGLVAEGGSLRRREQGGRLGIDTIGETLGEAEIWIVRCDLQVEVGATCYWYLLEDLVRVGAET